MNTVTKRSALLPALCAVLLCGSAQAEVYGNLPDPFGWLDETGDINRYDRPWGGYGLPGTGGYGTSYPYLGGHGYPGGYGGYSGYDGYGGHGGYGYPDIGGYGGYGGNLYPESSGYGVGGPGGYGYADSYRYGAPGDEGYGAAPEAFGRDDRGYGGYGSGGYGSGGYDYGSPGTTSVIEAQAAEIERLKARIRELERDNAAAQSVFSYNPGAPPPVSVENPWAAPSTGTWQRLPGPYPSTAPVFQPDFGEAPRYRFQ